MKKTVVKIEIVIIILLSILIILSLLNNTEKNKKTEVAPGIFENEHEEIFVNSQTINGIKLDIIEYVYDPNSEGKLTIRMTNTNKTTKIIKGLNIKLLDMKQNELTVLKSSFYIQLSPNDFYEFTYKVTIPITEQFIPEYTIIE